MSKMIEALKSFPKNVEYTRKGGRHQFACKKGLFGVDCHTLESAVEEALHYFIQYYEDGEYDEDLKG